MSQLEGELQQPCGVHFAAYNNDDIAGYIFGRHIADEAEITKLAVAEKYRRRGVATLLVDHFLKYLMTREARNIHLELRTSNIPARRLYEKFGFSVTGNRKNYYNNPIEDAVMMRRIISQQ